eukprot:m.192939 g.192939  ORF g.192939 m.192939 type:complete len:427 (-) comp18776_c0_seq1:259-1539(-)
MLSMSGPGDEGEGAKAVPVESSLFDPTPRNSVGVGDDAAWQTGAYSHDSGELVEQDVDDGLRDGAPARRSLFDEQAALLARDVDAVTSQLRQNVMSAFARAKIEVDDHYAGVLADLKSENNSRCDALQREIDELTELIESYVQSAAAKDQVIDNLKHEVEMERANSAAKARDLEEKEHSFDRHCERVNSTFARRHYETVLLRKAFRGLHGQVRSKWKQRMERACKTRAQEVCTRLQEQHELRERKLALDLEAARGEIAGFHEKRKEFQDGMRKAFLRGVSALNTEALSVFPDEIRTEADMFFPSGAPVHHAPASPVRTAATAPPMMTPAPGDETVFDKASSRAHVPPESRPFPREPPLPRPLTGAAHVSASRRGGARGRGGAGGTGGTGGGSLEGHGLGGGVPARASSSVRVERHAPSKTVRAAAR